MNVRDEVRNLRAANVSSKQLRNELDTRRSARECVKFYTSGARPLEMEEADQFAKYNDNQLGMLAQVMEEEEIEEYLRV